MNQKTREVSRNLHRDIAYLFLGLIISFSISGIALNHRRTFNPREYVYTSEPVQLKFSDTDFDDDKVKRILKEASITEDYRTFRVQNKKLRIFLDNGLVEADLKTGAGTLERTKKRRLLYQMTFLHQTTNRWWIWYSDIFGIAMLTIAITGTFISGGKFSFRKRGWKLMLIGIIFPLIFLFLIV